MLFYPYNSSIFIIFFKIFNLLDKYIKEEEIKISDRDEIEIKINITDEEDEDDEETNYSEKLEKIMSGKYKGNISIAHLLKILKDKFVSN